MSEPPRSNLRTPLLLCFLTGSLILSGCDRGDRAGAPSVPTGAGTVPVRVAKVTQADVPLALRGIGTVEAYQTVTVRPRVEGQLTEIRYTEGQTAQEGDLLARIDARPYEAELRLAQAMLAKNQALLTDARREAERIVDLFAAQRASERERDAAQAQADAAAAQIDADEAQIETARLNVEFCTIRAPIAGRIGAKLTDAGNVVQANQTALLVIHQIEPIFVTFALAERHLSAVREHAQADKLVVEARVPDGHESIETGELTFLDNEVDRSTGTFRIKAIFPNPQHRLWPGQFVQAALVLTRRLGVIVVPAEAVQSGPDGTLVFVVKDDRTVEMRTVTAADTVDGRTVIPTGLTPGETVVTDGQLRLTPGARVEIKPPVVAEGGG